MSQNVLLPFLFAVLERRTGREMVWMSLENNSGYLTFGEVLHCLLGLQASRLCDGPCCLAEDKGAEAEVPPHRAWQSGDLRWSRSGLEGPCVALWLGSQPMIWYGGRWKQQGTEDRCSPSRC